MKQFILAQNIIFIALLGLHGKHEKTLRGKTTPATKTKIPEP